MKKLLALLLLAAPAFAQQPAQPPSPGEQALSDQLIDTIRSCVNVRASLVDTQRKLAEAQEKIKTLEAKPDDKTK